MFVHVFRWQPRRGPTTYAHRAVMIYLDYTSFNRNGISPRLILFRSIHNEYQDHQFHWTMDHGSVLVNKQRALAGKYTRMKIDDGSCNFFGGENKWGYDIIVDLHFQVSKKKPYRISWAFSPPPLPWNYHPFLSTKKKKLRYFGASTADDKWFFPSSLHGCSVWWPETQLVGWSPKIDPDPRIRLKDCQKFQPQQKGPVCFLVDSPEHQNFKSFWRIQSGKWRWFLGGDEGMPKSELQGTFFFVLFWRLRLNQPKRIKKKHREKQKRCQTNLGT